MGSGVRTTLTDVTIECENPYSSGQNNYGAIVFGASSDNDLIYGNSVTVNRRVRYLRGQRYQLFQ